MRRTVILPALIVLLVPGLLLAEVAERDSLYHRGHDYRQWIFDQNYIGDQNSNLDPEISFVADGRIRVHPERVYFYNNIDLAIQIAKETGYPLSFYLSDHTCKTCLYRLPEIFENPDVVEASRNFVNVFVDMAKEGQKVNALGMMHTSLTVQIFLPSLRRLRVIVDAEAEDVLKAFDATMAYCETLSFEERLSKELELKKSRSKY